MPAVEEVENEMTDHQQEVENLIGHCYYSIAVAMETSEAEMLPTTTMTHLTVSEGPEGGMEMEEAQKTLILPTVGEAMTGLAVAKSWNCRCF